MGFINVEAVPATSKLPGDMKDTVKKKDFASTEQQQKRNFKKFNNGQSDIITGKVAPIIIKLWSHKVHIGYCFLGFIYQKVICTF
jgi:hypothetical protein